ncbi:MAG: hypothetical protein AAFV88_13620 [Planctomycetota bacterium]
MIWLQPLIVTLQLMGLSLLISLLGVPLAFCISGMKPRSWCARFCVASLIAAIATPMVLHAAAWEATAGKFGWMTFSQTAARTYGGLGGIYSGLIACAWIHGIMGLSFVTLATHYAVSRIPSAILDQARLDGGSAWVWWRIGLTIGWPWVMTALLATALLAATEMTVVNLYGVRTLAEEFYLLHAAAPSSASVFKVLVVPSLIAFAFLFGVLLPARKRKQTRLLSSIRSDEEIAAYQSGYHVLTTFLGVLGCGLLFLFPLFGLIIRAGQVVQVAEDGSGLVDVHWSLVEWVRVLGYAPVGFGREYMWTSVLAIATAVFCLPLAWLLASLSRQFPWVARLATLATVVLFVLPGPIVGLSVVRFFALPIPGFAELYRQTLFPTVLSVSARALPICYWILRAGYWGIDDRILEMSRLDYSPVWRWLRVDRVMLARPLVIAFVAAGLSAAADVPATLPVQPPGVVTAGTRLFALIHSGARNQESALAFWYASFAVLLAMGISVRWKKVPQ